MSTRGLHIRKGERVLILRREYLGRSAIYSGRQRNKKFMVQLNIAKGVPTQLWLDKSEIEREAR